MTTTTFRTLLLAAALATGLPVASAQTVNPGVEALDASLVAARFRTIGSTSNGAQRIFAGLPDLGTPNVNGTPNRVETGANWGALSTTSNISFSLDRAQNQLVARIGNATGPGGSAATYTATYTDVASRLAAIKGTQYGLDDLNVLRISIRREANASLTLSDLRINNQLLPGVTLAAPATGTAGSEEWSVVDVCLGAGNGFSFSAVLSRAGTFSNSQEGNKVDFVAGVSRARGLRCVNPADITLVAAGFTPATIAAGQTAELALTARNQGPGALGAGDAPRIDFTLPAPLTHVSNDASCDVSALPVVRCALGALAAGAEREVRFVVSTPGNAATQSLTVAATAAAAVYDGNASNNTRGAPLEITATPPLAATDVARLDASPSNLATVRWSVRFDRAVTGVDAGDFVLVQDSGLTGAATIAVTGKGTDYVVSASTGNGLGGLRLDLVDDDTIRDAQDNPLGGVDAGNGNRTGESYVIDAVAPSLAGLAAVGAPANGEFVGGVTLDGAITRLLVRWSEPMQPGPAGDAARFVLLDSGADGAFSTSACGAAQGDDQPLVLAASYLAAETSSVLVPAGPDGLRPGRWRLLVCAGHEDRVGNPLAAVAPLDFEVAFDNALLNPNFDESLDGFTPAAPGGVAGFSLLADDAQGTLASRALEITAAAGPGTYTLTQCVAAPLLAGYGTGLRARADGDASVSLEVELRRLPDCEGPVLGSQVLPINAVAGQWTRTDGVSAAGLSTGIFSARVTVRVVLGAPTARIAIDNLYFDRRGTLAEPDGLFSSSFED